MSGETLTWMRLAAAQHTTLGRCKRQNPSSHLPLWGEYFTWEDTEKFNSLHHYLARTNFELELIRHKGTSETKTVYLKDHMIEFRTDDEPKEQPKRDNSPEAVRARMAQSKSFWAGMTGLKIED